MAMGTYEIVMGLEIHVELATRSKIFCGCSTEFGGAPNSHVCEICSGMPGTLPALNRRVVEYAIRAGLATNCEIARNTQFDRKNYFYPDLPKAYQVSQLYLPICRSGYVNIPGTGEKKRIGIREIHMEEDAGKLIHDPDDDCTLVDYNRCGVPLIEIVTDPDFRDAGEVVAFLEKIKSILQYLGVSDCKMEEGSMRADINLSARSFGSSKLGTRTEMKNMASLKAIADAIEGESKRQIDFLEKGGVIVQETRRWDESKGRSTAMRSKEDAHDYKYFPEPDLVPIRISDSQIEKERKNLPELPEAKKRRYMGEYGLPEYDADILTGSRYLVNVFERAVDICRNPKDASNWIMTDLLMLLREARTEPEEMCFSPDSLGVIISMVNEGKINRNVGRQVLSAVFSEDVDPEAYVEKNGLSQISDADSIEPIIRAVLRENENAVSEFLGGRQKNFQFLVGQSMKALKGKADPQVVRSSLEKMLKGLQD